MRLQSRTHPVDDALQAAHYHQGRNNSCPDCGGNHWLVGRIMAQCAYCDAALPLHASHHRGSIYGFS